MPAQRPTTPSPDDLYTLVHREIKKLAPRYANTTESGTSSQLERHMIGGPGISQQAISEIISNLRDSIAVLIPNRIISGLVVTADSAPTNYVNVAVGKGVAGGKSVELDDAERVEIPMDGTTRLWYIVLDETKAVYAQRSEENKKLTIAKIIIPKPGITVYIQDDKPKNNSIGYGSWNGYIINLQDVRLHQYNGKLEEDSVELLRESIGDILAENIIGNIRLSENLKILNSAGTLELDSSSMKLYDLAGNTLAKFNPYGMYFYNNAGTELARFTIYDAHVGNVVIDNDGLRSTNFVSGHLGSGFQINTEGNAEFNDILARGKITTAVFEKASISTIGGNLLVMDGDVLNADMTALDSSTVTIKGDTTFAVNDFLRIKDGTDDEWMKVTNTSSAPTYTVTRDQASGYDANSNPVWKKGTAVVNFGASGEGGIYLTASESNAPYVSVVTHAGAPWTTLTTHARLGNLNGFLGYTSDTYGLAIGNSTSFLKYDATNNMRITGSITITGGIDLDDVINSTGNYIGAVAPGNVAPASGAGLYLGSDYMGYYDSSVWKAYIDNTGNFLFKGDATNYVEWDGATMTVRGALNASDITTGTLAAARLTINAQGYSTDITWTATDFDTATWSSGTITLADGTTKAIDAGNTGNMAATTYIYFDNDTSVTVLQTSTTYSDAAGANKILIAIAELGAASAKCIITTTWQGTTISGANITTGTIDADRIAAGSIVASKIAVDGTITVAAGGAIQSADYSAGSAGYQLTTTSGLEINEGTILVPLFSIPGKSLNMLFSHWFSSRSDNTFPTVVNGNGSIGGLGNYIELDTGADSGGTDNAILEIGEIDFSGDPGFVARISETNGGGTGTLWFVTGLCSSTVSTSTANHFGFKAIDGTLYATTADGSTETTVDISAGVNLAAENTYVALLDSGTNCKFYVNGTLKATITTNLPTGTFGVAFKCVSLGGTSGWQLRVHYVSVWMNIPNVPSTGGTIIG